MGFSLSRCSNKPKTALPTTVFTTKAPIASKLRATVHPASRKRPLPNNRPPIPSFTTTNFAQLEELEREFLGEPKARPLQVPKDGSLLSKGVPTVCPSDDESEADSVLLKISAFHKPTRTVTSSCNKSTTLQRKVPLDVKDAGQQQPFAGEGVATEVQGQNQYLNVASGTGFDYGNGEKTSSAGDGGDTPSLPQVPPSFAGAPKESIRTNDESKTAHSDGDFSEIQQQIDVIFRDTTDMNSTLKQLLKKVIVALGRPLTLTEKAESTSYIRKLVKERINAQRINGSASDKENMPLPSSNAMTKDGGTAVGYPEKLSSKDQVAILPTEIQTPGSTNEYEFCGPVQVMVATKPTVGVKQQRATVTTNDTNATEQQLVDSSDTSNLILAVESECSVPNTRRKRGRPSKNTIVTELTETTAETRASGTRKTESAPGRAIGTDTIPNKLPPLKRRRPSSQVSPVDIPMKAKDDDVRAKSAPKPPVQRRTRKGTCALCTTCPCNTTGDRGDDPNGTMFARSDSAVEKALIRRVQKMEKTCELHESRMVIVKRKLVQHRRAMWKKKEAKQHHVESVANKNNSKQQYQFLPDADEVEHESHRQGSSLPKDIVEGALVRIFPEVPRVQATLSEWLGLPDHGASNDDKRSSGEGVLETIMEEDHPPRTNMPVEDGDETYIRYSKGVEYSDEVHRQEWNVQEKSVLASSSTSRYSLWKILSTSIPNDQNEMGLCLGTTQYTQTEVRDDNQTGDDRQCPWDDLFEVDGSEVAGINQLVGLFGDDKDLAPSTDELASGDDTVHISHLSQTGQTTAIQLIESIEKDARKLELLEAACPRWKENVAFSMKQQDEQEVLSALDQVQTRRRQMLEFKRRIMDAWERQDMTLEVYEQSLSASLSRRFMESSKNDLAEHFGDESNPVASSG
jgi:hypothetical protein